ncbi:NAD(P)-binding protein [Ceratobasidium sp. AG-I]|nr:NAD(P)-binding protein [Ceratobasidium sp. AG-I]
MSESAANPPPRSRVAVITGAGQGIGRAIAQKFASEGYLLALGDLASNQTQLGQVASECTIIQKGLNIPEFTPQVYHCSCDVSVESQVESLVQAALTTLGGIDVMVANAGIYKDAPLLETSDEMFDQLYAVNIKGVLYSYRAAARAMIPRGSGRIIGASSVSGKGGEFNKGAYCASKAAVRSLTQTAAREWGRHGITVNAYAPGPVDTDMWNKDVLGGVTGGGGVLDRLVTGKISSPDEIAGLVSFLASPAATNITGQAISINGGLYME